MRKTLSSLFAAALAITVVTTSSVVAYDPKPAAGAAKAVATAAKGNIVETAAAAGSFSTLLKLATDAGLAETLSTGGPFTVFAPTDEAFKKVPAETLAALAKDKEALKKVLLYHVVDGKVDSKVVVGLTEAKTLNGAAAKISVKDGSVFVDGAKVTTADVMASNGVIHVIDSVILPPAAEAAAAPAATQDIVATAVGAGNFTTLASLLTSAALVETLQGPGPFTVFAPTDEAFKKVPAETLAALGADKAKLAKVLTYHVVAGNVGSADVVKLTEAKTVEGSPVKIAVKDGKVVLNGTSTVTTTDIKASNGTIHVIDSVILPPGV